MQDPEIIYKKDDCIVVISPIISEDEWNTIKFNFNFPELSAKSLKRRLEWATTHILLKFIFKEIVTYKYTLDGKPVLDNRDEKISISHSHNYCTVIISKTKAVGVDIEEPSDRIYKIADRFISVEEEKWIQKSTNKRDILFLIWCAKESLYKVTDEKPDFKENLFVEEVVLENNGKLKGRLCLHNSSKIYDLFYISTDKYIMAFTI